MIYFPPTDAHYLTRDGDCVDSVCYSYYGTSSLTTEMVLARNSIIQDSGPILEAGKVIVLPSISSGLFSRDSRTGLPMDFIQKLNSMTSGELRAYLEAHPSTSFGTVASPVTVGASISRATENSIPLWDYRARSSKLYVPEETSPEQEEAAALEAYRKFKQASQGGSSGGGTNPNVPTYPTTGDGSDGCGNPLLLDDFEWFAVYYRDTNGKWKLGRIHKRRVKINTDGYGHTISLTSPILDDPLDGGLL